MVILKFVVNYFHCLQRLHTKLKGLLEWCFKGHVHINVCYFFVPECTASDLLEELMSSEVFAPLLRLSPPPGDHDYVYNLDESEGVCDLFDVPIHLWRLNLALCHIVNRDTIWFHNEELSIFGFDSYLCNAEWCRDFALRRSRMTQLHVAICARRMAILAGICGYKDIFLPNCPFCASCSIIF